MNRKEWGREGGLLSPPSRGKNRWLFYRTRIILSACFSADSPRLLRFMRKERHRSYGAEVGKEARWKAFSNRLILLGLHSPQRSCLKQGENTVKTVVGRWNPYAPSDSLAAFISYNLLAEKRHLPLPTPLPTSPTCRSNNVQSGYSEGATASNPATPKEQQRPIRLLRLWRNSSR